MYIRVCVCAYIYTHTHTSIHVYVCLLYKQYLFLTTFSKLPAPHPSHHVMLTFSFNSRLMLLSQVLYQQFKFFLNLYFLVVACSQFVPSLKIGHLYTYWAPLVTLSALFTNCTLKSSSIWKNCLS